MGCPTREKSAMHTVARIRKLGFRRWYERTLIEAYAHLVTCLLGTILAFAGIEMVVTRTGPAHGLLGVGVGALGLALSLFGVSHFARIFSLAQRLGARATCPSCGTYAIFTVVAGGPEEEQPPDDAPETDGVWLKVKCRKCDNTWTI
jgi:ribosomal protein S27E